MPFISMFFTFIRALLRDRLKLATENLALRQQIAVQRQTIKRPELRKRDRIFWVVLSRIWSSWRSALAIVRPETVIRWHRLGFKLIWNWKSRRGKRTGRPRIDKEIRDLIRQMSRDNPTWGYPKIKMELKLLGHEASRSTDSGASWSPPSVLFEGRYTNAPTSVMRRGDTIYRAFETCPPGNGNWQSLVVAGDATRDLLDPAAWRMSNHVPYPGTPATFKQGDHPQGLYPPQKNIPEDGWLEGNVVAVGALVPEGF